MVTITRATDYFREKQNVDIAGVAIGGQIQDQRFQHGGLAHLVRVPNQDRAISERTWSDFPQMDNTWNNVLLEHPNQTFSFLHK